MFLEAIERYGRSFDVCSLPYNIRHRAAEQVMPVAKKAGLGVVDDQAAGPRRSLWQIALDGADAGIARDMIAFVLENENLDVCICGVHTEAQVRENFSASWTKLSPPRRERLEKLAALAACPGHGWLEKGWRSA